MKISKVMTISAVATSLLITTAVFAADTSSQNADSTRSGSTIERKMKDFGGKRGMGGYKGKDWFKENDGTRQQRDPLKMLENRKEQIQTMLKDGKITEEKANTEIARIDEQIKEMQAFNAMTLDQKKEKLTSDFKASIQQRVQDGKLTQEKADEMLASFTEKLANWDGTGNFGLRFGGEKRMFGQPGHGRGFDRGTANPATAPQSSRVQ